ncbi:MAG: hypothetical protein FD180_1691 [Planctomycetota bacterium]|nr:MAG: hypothetical protein FD180_1691 [Planctomycetota bacterium]
MAENRFHELLGLPEEVSDPDYYQLLGVDRTQADPDAIEARFKEQMTHVQHIENPRHKEFVEFLKGELKRARSILTDEERRGEYDKELAEERGEELRKILSHMLVDGTLSSIAEISVLREGRNLGLDDRFTNQVVNEELKKAGARRVNVAAGSNGHQTQVLMNRKAQEVAHQMQEARMAARIADTRAKIAETHQKKAEDQVVVVMQKARQAELQKKQAVEQAQATRERARQAEIHKMRAEQKVEAVTKKAREAETLARKAITREHLAAARQKMSEQERKQLEAGMKEAETRFQAYVEASNEELESVRAKGLAGRRLTMCYSLLCVSLVAGAALPKFASGAASSITRLLEPYVSKVGGIPHAAVPLIAIAILLPTLHWLAGKRSTGFFAPLLAILALGVAAGVLRG